MLQIVIGLAKGTVPSPDVRDLIIAKKTLRASHLSGNERPSYMELYSNYYLDESLKGGLRSKVILFDDVLTSGTHFVACKDRIQTYNPSIEVKGVFFARKVHYTPPSNTDFLF